MYISIRAGADGPFLDNKSFLVNLRRVAFISDFIHFCRVHVFTHVY